MTTIAGDHMTTEEAIKRLHHTHGDFLAEVSVESDDKGRLNVNVALSKLEYDEPIGLISFNAPTLDEAIIKAASA